MRMRALTSFPLHRFAVLLGFAALALVLGCEDESTIPAGPEDQSPSFYHDGGIGDGSADDVKILEENLAGDGTQVCNDSQLKDPAVVGDDDAELTWRGKKVDPPEDDADHGFEITLKGKKKLSWTDDGPNLMQAVLIKAGASSVVYYYNEGEPGQEPDPVQDFADDDLDGDDQKQISHYVYCFIPQPSVVRGAKFDDADGDGAMGADESALGGWEIHAYADDGNGTLNASEISAGPVATTTTAGADDRLDEGHYELRLDPGDYVICEVRKEGWNQSAPSGNQACEEASSLEEAGHAVSLAAGESDEGNDFGNNQSTIEVTVLDEFGDAVKGHTVVAIHEDNGPYRDDGSLQVGQTDGDGFTVIGDLEPGAYCVRTSPLGVPSGRVVPPSDPDEAPSLAANLGTAVTGDPDDTGVALTLSNFKAECLNVPDSEPDKPFINLGAEVTLILAEGPGAVEGSFQTLDGDDDEISAWMVADLTGLVPWAKDVPSTDVAAVKVGLLVSAAQDEGTPDFSIQTPGGQTIIESDKVPVGNPTFQAASTSASGTGNLGAIATEPLFCVAHELEENSGDGGQVEFEGPYRHGFLASAELEVLEEAFGISYAQTSGEAKLKLRARSKNTKRLVVDYACEDGTCEVQRTSGALANRVNVTLGTAGDQRVRWMISGLPQGTDLVQSGVSGPGDDIPDSSRDDNNDGLVEAPVPDACETGGSTWVIGG